MSLSLYRKPKGFFKEDISFYVSSDGQDSPLADGTIGNPFATPGYVIDKTNPRGFPEGYFYYTQRIVLGKPPAPPEKFAKPRWTFNLVLDDEKQSKRIFDLNYALYQQDLNNPIFLLQGVYDIYIVGGTIVGDIQSTTNLIEVYSKFNFAGISTDRPQGDAYGIEILNNVIKDFPQFIDIYGNPKAPICFVSAGDDCIVNGNHFFNNYLGIILYITGIGARIENCVFSSCTKAILTDRRLVTAWNLQQRQPFINIVTWSLARNALNYPRVIQDCIFKDTSYVIDYKDYIIELSGTVDGNIVSVTNSDLSAVTWDTLNYFPVSANEMVGDVLIDSNFNEFEIVANDAFNGTYPFTIVTNGNPVGPTFWIRANLQKTLLVGNIYADNQVDSDNDGVCDYAGNYPPKGIGLGKTLYPDPFPIAISAQVLQKSISIPTTGLNTSNTVNQLLTDLAFHEQQQAAHRELERQRSFYFTINSISATIRDMQSELIIFEKDKKEFVYTLRDTEGSPFDLTNYNIRILMKKYVDSPTPVFDKFATILSPTEGVFKFTIESNESEIPGNYVIEYMLVDQSQNKMTIAQQNVKILRSLL